MDGPLSLPIVIPQQRPGSRSRGFIACYSPALEACGIDQKTFLKFLNEFNTALRGNKLIAGVEAAAFGVGFTPEVMVALIATAVEAGAYMANKGFVRRQTNSALDKFNDELFGPRGLFCMVMKYSPNPKDPEKEKQKQARKAQSSVNLRKSSNVTSSMKSPITGTVNGPSALPIVAAPLIFMDDRRQHRDFVESDEPTPSTLQKLSKPKTFDSFNDYLDRRARARYAAENGDILAVPARGSHVDGNPIRPQSAGGLVGKFKDPDRKRTTNQQIEDEERRLVDEYRWQVDRIRNSGQHRQDIEYQLKRCEEHYTPRLVEIRDRKREGGDPGKKRKIKKNILYLTIVNKPSDAQLAEAMGYIQQNHHQFGQPVQI